MSRTIISPISDNHYIKYENPNAYLYKSHFNAHYAPYQVL